MNKLCKIVMIFVLVVSATSCGNRPPKFLTNGPFYLKGLKEVQRGEYEKAESAFLKDLAQKKSYAGHLQLMFIYEQQEKFPEVIVQCDQYLSIAPQGDSNLDLVKEIRKNALVSLHMQLNSKFGLATEKKATNKEKVENFFREKWYESRVRERDLAKTVAELESKISLNELIEKEETPKKVQKLSPKVKSKPSLTKNKTYRVVKGDSLSVISSKVFGTSKRWREIQSANLPALDNPNKLRVGQLLNIPQPVEVRKKSELKKSPGLKVLKKPTTVDKDQVKKVINKSDSTKRKAQTSKPVGLQKNPLPRGRD